MTKTGIFFTFADFIVSARAALDDIEEIYEAGEPVGIALTSLEDDVASMREIADDNDVPRRTRKGPSGRRRGRQ